MYKPSSNLGGYVAPFEYIASGGAFLVGTPLKMSAGAVVKCGATDTPEFVSVTASAASGQTVAVQRIVEDQEYETTLAEAPASGSTLNVGDKVTIGGTNMDQVTATTTSGVFAISYLAGTAVGDIVRGYFRR